MPISGTYLFVLTALAGASLQQAEFALAAEKKETHSNNHISDERASRLIASASTKLRAGRFSESEKELLVAKSLVSDPAVRAIWNTVFAELKEAQGIWSEAAHFSESALRELLAVAGSSEGRTPVAFWNPSTRAVVVRAIRNYLLAGLVGEAFGEFERFKNEFQRDLLPAADTILLRRLADELRRLNRPVDAASVEKIAFRFYPFVARSLLESLTPDTVCRLDADTEAIADKRARGTALIQRYGSRPDIMSYALSLAGVPAALRLVQQNPDTLSGQTRHELLDISEWLQSVREYPLALELTSKLIASQIFEPPLTRERLFMVHARNLNGVHRPVEAAAFYRSLILQFPQTDIANTARPRYVLSLHYAGQYEDVAREAATLAGILKPKDVLWRTFWAQYLSKKYTLALASTAHETGQDQRARLQYWRGRAYELDGQKQEAKEIFNRISSIDGSNHYALFASWKLSPGKVQPVAIPRGNVAFAARGLRSVEKSEVSVLRNKAAFSEAFAPYSILADAGYFDLLKGRLRQKLQKLSKSGDLLAEFVSAAGDAHASVQFATNQRKVVGRLPIGRNSEWKKFLGGNSKTFKLLYPLPYRETIADAAEEFKISPWLILSIMRAESLFQPQVVSNVGARGLMQIMPTTGERIADLLEYPDFEPSQLDIPNINITFGSWYLSRLLTYYRGNLPLAIAAYNAGPVAVDRWLERNSSMNLDEFLEDVPFDQTRKYVATVLTNMEIYSRLYSNGVSGVEVDLSVALPTPRNDMEIF
jgi:soluble lytic murein transglycosylase-like protein